MVHTLHDMKATVARLADLRWCARQHPWLVTGSAVVAGFVTGAVLTPCAEEVGRQAQERSEAEGRTNGQEREAPRPKKSFLIATAGSVLAGVARAVVQSSIAAAAAAKAAPPSEAPSACDLSGTMESEVETE